MDRQVFCRMPHTQEETSSPSSPPGGTTPYQNWESAPPSEFIAAFDLVYAKVQRKAREVAIESDINDTRVFHHSVHFSSLLNGLIEPMARRMPTHSNESVDKWRTTIDQILTQTEAVIRELDHEPSDKSALGLRDAIALRVCTPVPPSPCRLVQNARQSLAFGHIEAQALLRQVRKAHNSLPETT